jgi:hypothetical protein
MTITVTATRADKPVNMEIDQLRGWATFMDRAVVVSLIVTILAVAALGVTTWLSWRFNGAVRVQEHAAFDRYKAEMGKHAAALEEDASRARERALEFEQAATDANERAARAGRESAAASEKARSAEVDAEEVRKRVAELGKQVREATARAPEPAPVVGAAETSAPAKEVPAVAAPVQASPIVESLKKYAGTKAALYVLEEAADGPAVGSAIAGYLTDAGWMPMTWTWTGVSGILGVVVLIKEGSDPATDEAASAVLDSLRSAGFNAAKGNWPADWRRFRGTLNGPQSPGPTDAPIRIVIGAKAR